jgi:hypothetical protein
MSGIVFLFTTHSKELTEFVLLLPKAKFNTVPTRGVHRIGLDVYNPAIG